ncbi:lytic transglycosylase domain-containing protein [Serratia symbiotica]|uniref:lytic transglycosylase domain-containing protein n=1 Tax=Serratia symbiotica TaxID=138074 RepID=UPI001321FBEF|nr:lytic transglycosylase domain-containing protein [Serratia symbiotica]QTP13349.1 lytic transglycosylase domain-containing protein [Serratia symbiotica]
MDGLPPLTHAQVEHMRQLEPCIQQASERYRINTEIFRAVVLTEYTKPGQVVTNKNGSVDMSVAGINSIHLPELKKFNIDKDLLVNNTCVNLMVGAWILAQRMAEVDINDPKQLWRAIGAYNSKTPKWNLIYQKLVWNNIQRLRTYYPQLNYTFKEMKVASN